MSKKRPTAKLMRSYLGFSSEQWIVVKREAEKCGLEPHEFCAMAVAAASFQTATVQGLINRAQVAAVRAKSAFSGEGVVVELPQAPKPPRALDAWGLHLIGRRAHHKFDTEVVRIVDVTRDDNNFESLDCESATGQKFSIAFNEMVILPEDHGE